MGKQTNINLEFDKFAEGAFKERAKQGIEEVMKNINDPNTDWKKKRKLTIELVFTPNEARDLAMVDIQTKAKLEPSKPTKTTFMMGTDGKGGIIASEFKNQIPGQSTMRVDEETGEVTTTAEEKAAEEQQFNTDGIKLVK